jgi:hypothetical protein
VMRRWQEPELRQRKNLPEAPLCHPTEEMEISGWQGLPTQRCPPYHLGSPVARDDSVQMASCRKI